MGLHSRRESAAILIAAIDLSIHILANVMLLPLIASVTPGKVVAA